MMRFRPIQDAQAVMGALQNEMNRVFDRVWHAGISTGPFDGQAWAPCIDLYEFPDRYLLLAEVAGIDAESIELTYQDRVLTIRGNRPRPAGAFDDTPTPINERRYGNFSRTVDLSAAVNADGISARCPAGVLEVTLPKTETARGRTIHVQESP
ncbi:MAG: Hsp20/alpha crystallin family protein [Planctomycetes bacterium]|nr:Hsp20/alpha crystallin family protein [Planctomycetota bacterium]MBI3835196.1 Hsp20/alpha crystallin family protein [Planctomycetota bacterium]